MQTKSEMINRIAELAKENAELKQEVKQLKHEYEMLDACIELEQGKMSELKAENDRLKEENKELCERMATVTYRATGGRLSYSNYTLDAIEQAFYDQLDILSDQKIEPYKQTLQEIKGVVTALYMNNWLQMNETARKSIQLLQELITKAEEE